MTLLADAPFLRPGSEHEDPAERGQASRGRGSRGWGGGVAPTGSEREEVGTLGGRLLLGAALGALTLASAGGFHRIFTDQAWVMPVLITALATHALSALLRWTRVPPLPAMGLCLAAVALIGTGTALGLSAFHGFPASTWQLVSGDVTSARADLPTVVAPVPTTAGFVLLASWGVGLVAVLGDWGTFRLRSAAQGAGPALVLFVVCCVLGGPVGRTITVSVLLVAAIAYLLIHQTVARTGVPWFAGRRARSLGPTLGAGAAIGAAALLVAISVTPGLSTQDGRGVLGWRHGPGPGGTRLVESPIVDLRTRIVTESNVPVFTVRSPVADYWRLTSLDTFTGTLWESTDSYQGVHDRLPGVSAASAGAQTVVEHFHIQNLDSIWLPAAFDPQAVVGGGRVTYDPTSESLLTNHATSNDLDYQVTSVEQLDTLNAAKLASAPAPPHDALTARYLQLPAAIPSQVVALARKITSGDTTEYAKALALQDYLLGPSFTYSTDPPTDGYGTSALATFLLDTRIGYCQQFAGSFAVMARIVGIPTRLAVGFATGTPDGNGTYHVTDADAHTWPEVYFPSYGWVPFEPTKGNFAIPGGDAYTGSKIGDQLNPNFVPSQVSTSAPSTPAHLSSAGASTQPAGLAGRTSGHHSRRHDIEAPLAVAVGVILVALVLWPAVNASARHRGHTRRRRRAGPDGSVLVAWQEIGERLAWRGVRRASYETPSEFARRAGVELAVILDPVAPPRESRLNPDVPVSEPHRRSEELAVLADVVDQARFSAGLLPPAVTRTALAAAGEVERALRNGAPIGLRLRWWLDPRLAWTHRPAAAP